MENSTSKNSLSFGAPASPFDARDHKDTTLVSDTSDKYFTDLTGLRVRMQYKIGKCTGASTAKKLDSLFTIDSSDDFLYRGTKEKIDLDGKEGSAIRSVLKFAQKYGVCTREAFEIPVTSNMTYLQYMLPSIPDQAYTEATKFKIGRYYSLPVDVSILKAAIRKYGTILVRMEVGDEWYTPSWNASDILPLKAPKKVISGHAVVLYGYDSTLTPGKTAFYVANSWSKAWASNGNGYFFYEDYAPTEAWAVTLEPVPTTEDKSPVIEASTFSKFLDILRKLNILK